MKAPWSLTPLGDVQDQTRFIVWEFEGAKFGHRVVNHPTDPGGRTLSGLTWKTYSEEYLRLPAGERCPVAEFDALTLDDVVHVILELFGMRTSIWQITDAALRLVVLDFAIHAGAHDDAIPALQRALGVGDDGFIGPATLGALAQHGHPRQLFAAVLDARYQKAGRRVVQRHDQIAFLAGWLDRFGRLLRIGAAVALLTLCSAYIASAQTLSRPHRPNPVLTPGVTRNLSLHAVCSTTWGRDVRHVTEPMRRRVFTAYGIPYADHAAYELDHLIPRALGGADDVANLWPQPLAEAKRFKDPLEVRLHRLVCSGELSLSMAQDVIRQDWPAAHRLFITTPGGSR